MYTAKFYISYQQFLNANSIQELNDEMIEKWKTESIYNFEKLSPTDIVMNMFHIPINERHFIEHHKYSVSCKETTVNKEKSILVLDLELKFIN